MILSIPLFEIHIDEGSHLIAYVYINKIAARMIIDTGATCTIFDEKRITNYLPDVNKVLTASGKVTSGIGKDTVKVSEVQIDCLRIGELRLYDYKATAMNLDSVARAYNKLGFDPADGILGSDFLRKYKAVIDYEGKKMLLTV